MHSILELGYAVPDDVRLVGIDDMDYANLLPVPLTTLRQPTREIGAAAFAAMLDRVSRPETPVRDILLQTKLVVRRSCGASAI
jgi:DNA-binding LacI/PurR family transcriptional regulator